MIKYCIFKRYISALLALTLTVKVLKLKRKDTVNYYNPGTECL